ncbi:MAG: YaiO family outer membrane beta-barrel protein [Polynucleobacter sp.]|nr:YaiO family outer membrane beta-barrel protein [Polynucleobacter sp.]
MKINLRLIHSSCSAVYLLLHSNGTISQIVEESTPLIDRPAIFDSKPYIETGGSYENLTNQYKPWDAQYIDFMLPLKAYGLIYAQLQNANRFDQSDQSVYGNYAYPTSWGVINIEGGYTHNPFFFAKNWYGAGWTGKLPKQFNYLISARQSEYTDGNTLTQNIGLDKYLGAFRLAYLASYSTLNSQKSGWLNRYQAQWFFNSNDRIGFTYASGHEPTVVNIGNLTTVDTQQYQVDGVYWLTNQYAVTGALWHAKQGGFYQRNGLQIGIRIAY